MENVKNNNILKLGLVAVLAIAMFTTMLMGVNTLALASATGGTEVLASSDPVDTSENELREGFVMPNLTLLDDHLAAYVEPITVPASAMSVEEAMEIGAKYIWDVFGANIDGMYIIMRYSDWESNTRTYWSGLIGRCPDAFVWAEDNQNFGWSFSFMIDAVTGMRVDIDNGIPGIITSDYTEEDIVNWRQAVMDSGFWEMDAYEKKAYLGLTAEELEAYMEKALDLATRHFNNSEVVDLRLGNTWGTGINMGPSGGSMRNLSFGLASLDFTATDSTGREALVTIPAGTTSISQFPVTMPSMRVTTNHNDLIPGFWDGRIGTEDMIRYRVDNEERVLVFDSEDDAQIVRIIRNADGEYDEYTVYNVRQERIVVPSGGGGVNRVVVQ